MIDIQRYDAVARGFHWSVVVLLLAQYAVGWLMPDVERTTPAVGLIAVHLSIGFAILVVVAARIVWRFLHQPPRFPASIPAWQVHLSRAIHGLLYVLVVLLPVTGWLNASRRSWSPVLFAVLPMPRLPYSTTALGHTIGEWHSDMSWVLLALIGLHVLAAIYHVVFSTDETLWRM